MISNLLQWDIPYNDPDWMSFRTTGLTAEMALKYSAKQYPGGIGASEAATVLGLSSQYRPVLAELWHFKVGDEIPVHFDNEAMFHGRWLENYILRLWECWDGTKDGYMKNFEKMRRATTDLERNKARVRSISVIKSYLVNPDYPYLFVSLDGYAPDGSLCMKNDHKRYKFSEPVPGGFPVECKTIGHFEAERWATGVPSQYIVQINQQMLITDCYYAELPILKDGRFFDVLMFERNDDICRQLIAKGKEFWDRVIAGREMMTKADEWLNRGNQDMANEWLGKIQMLEPEVDENPAYKEYLSEKYKREKDIMLGNMELWDLAYIHKKVSTLISRLEILKNYFGNKLTKQFILNKVEEINFGSEKMGKLKYSKRGDNNNYALYNYLDFDEEEFINEVVRQINNEHYESK